MKPPRTLPSPNAKTEIFDQSPACFPTMTTEDKEKNANVLIHGAVLKDNPEESRMAGGYW
jgi:hypothetical protein